MAYSCFLSRAKLSREEEPVSAAKLFFIIGVSALRGSHTVGRHEQMEIPDVQDAGIRRYAGNDFSLAIGFAGGCVFRLSVAGRGLFLTQFPA